MNSISLYQLTKPMSTAGMISDNIWIDSHYGIRDGLLSAELRGIIYLYCKYALTF